MPRKGKRSESQKQCRKLEVASGASSSTNSVSGMNDAQPYVVSVRASHCQTDPSRLQTCPLQLAIPLEQASASNGPSQLPLGLHIPAAPLHLPPTPAPQKLAPAPLHLPPAPAPLNLSVAGPSPACAPKWAPVSTPQQMHKGSSSDPVGPGPSTSQPSSSQPKPSAEHGKKRRRKSEAPEWFEQYVTEQRRQMSELMALQKQAVEVASECNDILK
ncbi:cyclin-dependent kinase inhibitor 1C-like [Sinocyclocheilus rhinocerous]|uniref:cyclin-dependent kinase inhibitor 1C-like n=1 Tax=Sinocyclocheilus rhinocerous TaxID=307959 RepID=UPI0007B9B8D9|nr:PREDICTED: cyclin-dependent kinase inhibitor 1C-like [Sinocyclocheilus rhinocerous]